eukprot:gene61920-biopygen33193
MDLQVAVEMVVIMDDPVGNHYEESEILEVRVHILALAVVVGVLEVLEVMMAPVAPADNGQLTTPTMQQGAAAEIIPSESMGWVGPLLAAMAVLHLVCLEVTEQHTLVVAVEEAAAILAAIQGSVFCDICPVGYFSSSEGSTSCSACPAGSYSPPMIAGMQLYYRFDFVSGSRVGNIASGSVVYDATLQNGAIIANKSQLVLSAAGSQYMQIDSFTMASTGLTFATWWRSDNSGTWARLFDFGNGPAADNILIGSPDGSLYLVVYLESSVSDSTGSMQVPFNFNSGSAWNHVAWTLDPAGSGTWIVYINGVQVGSQA